MCCVVCFATENVGVFFVVTFGTTTKTKRIKNAPFFSDKCVVRVRVRCSRVLLVRTHVTRASHVTLACIVYVIFYFYKIHIYFTRPSTPALLHGHFGHVRTISNNNSSPLSPLSPLPNGSNKGRRTEPSQDEIMLGLIPNNIGFPCVMVPIPAVAATIGFGWAYNDTASDMIIDVFVLQSCFALLCFKR